MNQIDIFAAITLLSSLLLVLWIGVDAWILKVWALSGGVLLALFLIGRLLAREFGLRPRGRRLPWIAGGVAAFISCTMAAGLVRVDAPLWTFSALGLLMLMAVTSLRLAYYKAQAPGARAK